MAEQMDIPVIGIIENMSYYQCPDCGAKHAVFGESHIDEIAEAAGIPVLAKIPIDSDIAAAIDAGNAELLKADWLDGAVDAIVKD
jgi:Mrp family chromosome partitioning ATPase